MRFSIVICLCLFIHTCCDGQIDFTIDYFPYIHQADLKVVDGDYAEALRLYEQAFENVDDGFSVDFLNAAVCASKMKQNALAFRYLDSLITKGVEKEFLESFQGLESLRNQTEWTVYIQTYDQRRQGLLRSFNEDLRKQLETMHALDQEFRTKEGSYMVYRDTINKIDKQNVLAYIQIINTHGLPSEDLIGITTPNSTIPGSIVFHHHCQSMSLNKQTVDYDFTNDFLQAIRSGEIEPHKAAFYIGMQGVGALPLGGHGVLQLESNGNKSKLLASKYEANVLAEIAKNRKTFGLESLEEYYRKVVFKYRNPVSGDFIFDKYGQLNIFEGLDDATYERLMKACVPIE